MSTGTLWGCCCSWCNTLCWSSLLKPRARETPSRWTCANLSREEDEMLPITVLATAAPVCDPALALGEFLTAPYWRLWGEFIPLNSLPGLTGYGWKWHGCYTKLLWRIGGKKFTFFSSEQCTSGRRAHWEHLCCYHPLKNTTCQHSPLGILNMH